MVSPISAYFESLRHRFGDASSRIIVNTQYAFEAMELLLREKRPPDARSAHFEIAGVPFLVHEMDDTCDRFHVFATTYNISLGTLILSSKPTGVIVVAGFYINLLFLAATIAKHFHPDQKTPPATKKQKLMLFGFTESFGHHFWNEVSGLCAMKEMGLIDGIDGFIVGPFDYFNLGPSLQASGKTVWKIKSINSLTTPENLARYPCGVVSEETRQLVIANAAAQTNLPPQQPCAARAICFQIRRHRRVWVHEEDGLVELIKSCAEEWPEITFIIDGHSTSQGVIAVKQQEIDDEMAFYHRVLAKLGAGYDVRCTIGMDCNAKIMLLKNVSLFVGGIGSGGVLPSWILRIPLITYGTDPYANMIRYQEDTVPEGGTVCTVLESRYVTPIGTDDQHFDVDTAAIMRLIRARLNGVDSETENILKMA